MIPCSHEEPNLNVNAFRSKQRAFTGHGTPNPGSPHRDKDPGSIADTRGSASAVDRRYTHGHSLLPHPPILMPCTLSQLLSKFIPDKYFSFHFGFHEYFSRFSVFKILLRLIGSSYKMALTLNRGSLYM